MPQPPPPGPSAIVVMGVAGSGKTTVGREAARRLGWAFVDADDLHSPASRAKMRAGQALSHDDRAPWLAAVRSTIDTYLSAAQSVVVACSALTGAHRLILSAGEPRVRFVWLDVPAEELRRRLAERSGHFAGPDLLASQLDTLEPPAEAVRVPADRSLDVVVQAVVAAAWRGAWSS